MLGLESLKLGTADGGDGLDGIPTEFGCTVFEQTFGKDVIVAVCFDENVVEVRMHGHSHVVGNRPRGRGPDGNIQFADVYVGDFFGVLIGHGEAYVDGRGGVVLVFNLASASAVRQSQHQ